MIAVDTNILVYAHRRDSESHAPARSALQRLAEGTEEWSIPWPCVHEFLAVVTHPRIFDPPTPRGTALRQVEIWSGSPSFRFIGEGPGHWKVLRAVVEKASVSGPAIHDARVAAICLAWGVRDLWSADRDFTRYADLSVSNPLLG